MKQAIRNIQQEFWRHPKLPHVELRSTHDSPHSYKSHSHQEFSIGAIVNGSSHATLKRKSYLINAGELIFIEPNQIHSCNPVSNESRSYHILHLNKDWCLKKISKIHNRLVNELHIQTPKINDPELFDLYLKLVDSLHDFDFTKATQILDELCFNTFNRFCLISKGTEFENELTQFVKSRLFENLSEPPSLDELAAELNVRKETIIRTFGRCMGISPKAFLNSTRIEQAKIQLKAGLDIADVALQVGFSDQSHFHKTFAHYASATPRQYQKINF